MKITDHIVLLARDVPVGLLNRRIWTKTQSEWKTFGVVGVYGHWGKVGGGYVCPTILFETCGWMNLLTETTPYSGKLVLRGDDQAISEDGFEEMVLDLQLKCSERNVFEIPLKIVQELAKRSLAKRGQWHATSFVLPFEWHKDKCKRVI